MQPTAAMIALAAERLSITEEQARAACCDAPGLPTACFFTAGTGRGAGRLLVTRDLETLAASSAISPAQHVAAFQQGVRS